MADGIVGWRFFDAESGVVPEDLSPSILPGGGAGRIVVLASTPFARSEGWAGRAVVALAREWAKEDLRIFLMDLGLDSPALHRDLGLQNLEGVSDAFLYGASVQRIAQPALNDTIFFASAGTATTDPEEILSHPRWNDLAGGFSEADATLLLFLPTELPGAEKVLARATDILLLAGEGELAETHLGAATVKLVATCGPMASTGDDALGVIEASGGDGSAAGDALGEEDSGEREESGIFGSDGMVGTFGLADDLTLGDDVIGSEPDLGGPQGLRLAEGFAGVFSDAGAKPEEGARDEESSEERESGDLVFSDDFLLETSDGEGVPETQSPNSEDEVFHTHGIPDFEAEFAEMPGFDEDDGDSAGAAPIEDGMILGSGPPEDLDLGDFSSPAEGQEPPGRAQGEDEQATGGPGVKGPEDSRRYASNRLKPISARRPPPKKKISPGAIAGLVLGLVIIASAVGTAIGAVSVPGFGWIKAVFGDVPLAVLERPGPQPADPVLRFSLELLVYEGDEERIALEMRNTLRDRRPDLLFTLAPREIDGTVSYVLYAGPASDVVEVENLRVPISEIFAREDPESWPIRNTPRAFLVGEGTSLSEASVLLEEFENVGGLGYILAVSYPDGSMGYEVLSGAYQGTEDARWWQLRLREAGFRDLPLVERRGKPPE
jgi:hypothetical protein